MRELLVPIVHATAFEELEVSAPLISRGGLNTAEEPIRDVAAKIAELVTVQLVPGDDLRRSSRPPASAAA